MIIEGSRLLLRNWMLADAGQAFEFYGDPEVSKFIGDGKPVADVATLEKVLAKFIDHQNKFGFSPWAVVEKQSKRVVGICGFHTYNEIEEMELGFRITRSEWGTGIATEACLLSLDYAHSVLKPPHISASTDEENRSTQHLLGKVGFVRVGLLARNQHGRKLVRYEHRK
jgi:ribosomal-protein-alanine N-acetyltransferase